MLIDAPIASLTPLGNHRPLPQAYTMAVLLSYGTDETSHEDTFCKC